MAGRGFGQVGELVLLALVIVPVVGAAPRCRVVPETEALTLPRVWGRELARVNDGVRARAKRHAAFVRASDGTVLEALFLTALADAGGQSGGRRPRWVRCGG